MKFAQIRKFDVANGPGIRTSLFVSGCNLKCPGCFNKKYQNFNYGTTWSNSSEAMLLNFLKNEHVGGFSVLGGEPLSQDDTLLNLLQTVKQKINKSIWLWTGFCFEQLNSKQLQILKFVDVLVDGPFIESKKNLKLKFRGSSNQRIIDVQTSFNLNKIVILNNF